VRENTLLNGKMKLQKEEKFVREDDELEEVLPEALKEEAPEELDKAVEEAVA
jgi:hypothetical protein